MSLRKFFIHYSHFVTGSAISLLLGLISFPIFTRILTREEYGIMALVNTTMFLTVVLAKAGLSDGIIRFYKEYTETEEKLTVFSSTVMIRGFLFSAAATLLYVIIFPFAYGLLNIRPGYLACFLIMAVYLLIRPVNTVVLNMLRVVDKTIFYNIINLIGRVVAIAGSLVLLLYVFGFYGYFIGLVLSEVSVSLVLFYWFFSNYRVRFSQVSGELAVKLVKFGFPLLITELSYLLLSYADRYMIVAYRGEADLGLYSVGYNLAAYMSDMIMFSLSYAVIPIYVEIYQSEGREKTEEFLGRCMHYLLVAIIPIFFGFFAVSKDLFVALASEKYAQAASFSPVILLGSLFLGMNSVFNAGLYLKKKTKLILFIMLSAVIINIAMNYLLLPVYGVMGSALATLVACISATILTVLFSFRHVFVHVDIRTVIYYTALSAVMYALVSRVNLGPVWADMAAKALTGLLIIVPGILFRERELVAKIKMLNPLKNASL